MYLTKNNDIVSIGFATSFYYTSIFIINRGKIISHAFIKNNNFKNLFFKTIHSLFNSCIIDKNKISYITFLEGPSPLMSMGGAYACAKALSYSSKKPLVICNGVKYYSDNNKIILVIDLYEKKYLIKYNNKEDIYNENEFFKFITINSKEKYIFTREIKFLDNTLLEYNINYEIKIIPNIDLIANDCYISFLKKQL